ncbi:MAG: ABC transporter permease [Oscillospiraceae bacterium]|nr:ABC transporter permease [Oscillospiraceae bacterium]
MSQSTKNLAERKRSAELKKLLMRTEISMVLIIVLLFLAATFGTENFLSAYNLTNILKQCAIIGVISVAQTYIIITGGIDISCGAIVGMSTLMVAMGQARWGMGVLGSMVVALVVAIVCGLFNAVLIHEFNVPAFVATLGTQTILRGLIKVISNGGTVSGLSAKFSAFASGSTFMIPNLALIWFLIAIVGFLILKYTVFGRNLFVLGSGSEVAKLNGISIRKTTYAAYAFAGLMYGVAGIMLAARINSAIPTAGEGYETNAIAASVLGGASLAGGQGSIAGTLLGTMLIILIDNVGTQFGIHSFVMQVITGCVIVIAIVVDQVKKRKNR